MNKPHNVIIRLAKLSDSEAITEITNLAYAKYIPRLNRKPEPMTVEYSKMISNHPVFLLLINETPLGVLVLRHEEKQTLIWSVAIRPDFQGMGLGRHLLKHAENEALAHGYSSIRLYTNSLMTENIMLYKKLGYTETSREAYMGSTLIHMTKQLFKN